MNFISAALGEEEVMWGVKPQRLFNQRGNAAEVFGFSQTSGNGEPAVSKANKRPCWNGLCHHVNVTPGWTFTANSSSLAAARRTAGFCRSLSALKIPAGIALVWVTIPGKCKGHLSWESVPAHLGALEMEPETRQPGRFISARCCFLEPF